MVVDAAAVVDLLMGNEPRAGWVEARLETSGRLVAPHLLDIEVASAFRREALLGTVAPEEARLALSDLAESPILRFPVTRLIERIFELRNSLTTYDAAYVALAESLKVPLITTDERLARSTGHMAEILSPA